MTTTAMSALVQALAALTGCAGPDPAVDVWTPHGPTAEDIFGALGDPLPSASPEELATFERGRGVAMHRFTRAEGLGPAFNVTFCASCHEKPVIGGSSGLYRNFLLGGYQTEDGAFLFGDSAGNKSGVVRMYAYSDTVPPHPDLPDTTTTLAQRNGIPFFGVGLLASIADNEILRRADEDDADGDGISGRPNFDRGFVGRFGMKAQTVSIEGFIRGPLMNHVGLTTNPLTDEQRAALPIDSSNSNQGARWTDGLRGLLQAAAPDGPLTDSDAAPDPEMSTDDLFDLVSFSMLTAVGHQGPMTDEVLRGMRAFDEDGCAACHAPRLESPRGPLPVYSDLLVHDMGPDLADGIVMKNVSGSEFRTMPLWNLAAVGPYLHDGRAQTVEEAILWHGGEAEAARDAFADRPDDERAAVLAFLGSLGGAAQATAGLLPPGAPVPAVGELGAPDVALAGAELERFEAGRALFDKDFGFADGVGSPRFNGDSCRACHFEPVLGGAGPSDVNVMRHGIVTDDGRFLVPTIGTILHRETTLFDHANRPEAAVNVFEHRQTPHLFGLGRIAAIADDTILANADPTDANGDGISGKPSWTDGGRLGRFGWKAQVPSIPEFVRDAVFAELGLSTAYQDGLTFGRVFDNDEIADPEFSVADAESLAYFLEHLGPPPRATGGDAAAEARGERVFSEVGCDACHKNLADTAGVDVPLYSDLLLHEVLPVGTHGIEDASATMTEFRTAPLWGLAFTPPYLHTGAADTIADAIQGHDGEALAARAAYETLGDDDRDALLAFLGSL